MREQYLLQKQIEDKEEIKKNLIEQLELVLEEMKKNVWIFKIIF